jgi:hypothetical protein
MSNLYGQLDHSSMFEILDPNGIHKEGNILADYNKVESILKDELPIDDKSILDSPSSYIESYKDMATTQNNRPNDKRITMKSFRRAVLFFKKATIMSYTSHDPLYIAKLLKETEKDSSYTINKTRMLIIDVIMLVLVVANLVFSIIDNEVYIANSDDFMQAYMSINNISAINLDALKSIEQRIISSEENLFRCFSGICSILCCIFLVLRYIFEVRHLQIDDKLSKYDGLFSSGFVLYLLVEVIVCIPFYPPFINIVFSGEMHGLLYVYNFNSIFSILVLAKLYVSIRVITYTSRWNRHTALAICNKHKVKPGFQFTVKSEMKKRPILVLSIMSLIFLGILGFTLREFEFGIIDPRTVKGLKVSNDLSYLSNNFWLIIQTMMTLGYGDYFPRSHLGRFVGVFACIVGLLLLSLIVVAFSSLLEFSNEQKKAFYNIRKMYAVDKLEYKARDIIVSLLRLRKISMVKTEGRLTKRFVVLTQLRTMVTAFHKIDRQVCGSAIPLDDMLRLLNTKVSYDLDSLTYKISLIKDAHKEIECLRDVQHEQIQRMNKVRSMQRKLADYIVDFNNSKVVTENHDQGLEESSNDIVFKN